MKGAECIETKLVAPSKGTDVLFRPHLIRFLRKIEHYKLTVVQALPGYGKSTVVSSFLRSERTRYCWYTMSESDSNLEVFVRYLQRAVRTENENASTFVYERDGCLLASVINEWINVDGPLTIVIDQSEWMNQSEDILSFMDELIRFLPEHIHLVLLTRYSLSLPVIRELKVKSQLLYLSQETLSFKEYELEALCEEQMLRLQPEELIELHKLSSGWISPVLIIFQAMKNGSSFRVVINDLERTLKDLQTYLLDEIVSNMPYEIKTVLFRVAMLEQVLIEEYTEIFGEVRPEIFERLRENGFIFNDKNRKTDCFYPLIQQFLLTENIRMGQYKPAQKQIGDYYVSTQSWSKALYHYEESEQYLHIAQVIDEHAKELFQSMNVDKVLESIQQLGIEHKRMFPRILLYEGTVTGFTLDIKMLSRAMSERLNTAKSGRT
ncbi:hypothetical protein [Geomicrobium sp. JCM 19039]|uniref:hypothetical protein n=1 Tax=Geomicrobium sp. JCM 19039 TaxID=1460636 RepID=UPI00045F248E|nr:hypothetical protein [Geomicrobium sp. JCM 19039]GAK13290.1 hypothetical protein JCM19039_3128 [Geomicrobium sp. JCM 19039]